MRTCWTTYVLGIGLSALSCNDADNGLLDAAPTDADDATDGELEVPSSDAPCGEIEEFLRQYAAAHAECTVADECESAVEPLANGDCRFCNLEGIGSHDAAWRRDAVTPEVNRLRTHYRYVCIWGTEVRHFGCMVDTNAEPTIRCTEGRCQASSYPTGCPSRADGGDATAEDGG